MPCTFPLKISIKNIGIGLGCVKWHQTGSCRHNGTREPDNDKDCNEPIQWKSGYCQCSNGRKAMHKGCQLPSYYGFNFDTCEEACAEIGKNFVLNQNVFLISNINTKVKLNPIQSKFDFRSS